MSNSRLNIPFLLFLFVAAVLGQIAGAAPIATNLLSEAAPTETKSDSGGWELWSPRPELAAKGAAVQRAGAPVLSLETGGFESVGKWRSLVGNIEGGKYYRLEVQHQTEDVRSEATSVMVILSWFRTVDGKDSLQRDYVFPVDAQAGWQTDARTVRAPADARSVCVELGLRWAPGGKAYFKGPRLTQTEAPAPRKVRVATTRILPDIPTATVAGNTELMIKMFDEVAAAKPDVVLFSENLATRFVAGPLKTKAQPIPGPLTDVLAARARKYHTYVIATLLEAHGNLFHNTAVLIDREGRLVGRYRKVHLTMGETDGGLTPGNEYPVYDTDFGRIGIMTCWDNWFDETARVLRLAGAEILFLPLAGDGTPAHWEHVWKARTLDNGVWLVTSATVTDAPSRILNPQGEVLAETTAEFGYATAELDLNQEWRVRYMSVGNGEGEAATLLIKERRPDTYAPLEKASPVTAMPKPQ